jgi:hypothetical protein
MLYKQAFTMVHVDGFIDVLQRAPKRLRGMVREGLNNLHQHAIQAQGLYDRMRTIGFVQFGFYNSSERCLLHVHSIEKN